MKFIILFDYLIYRTNMRKCLIAISAIKKANYHCKEFYFGTNLLKILSCLNLLKSVCEIEKNKHKITSQHLLPKICSINTPNKELLKKHIIANLFQRENDERTQKPILLSKSFWIFYWQNLQDIKNHFPNFSFPISQWNFTACEKLCSIVVQNGMEKKPGAKKCSPNFHEYFIMQMMSKEQNNQTGRKLNEFLSW